MAEVRCLDLDRGEIRLLRACAPGKCDRCGRKSRACDSIHYQRSLDAPLYGWMIGLRMPSRRPGAGAARCHSSRGGETAARASMAFEGEQRAHRHVELA